MLILIPHTTFINEKVKYDKSSLKTDIIFCPSLLGLPEEGVAVVVAVALFLLLFHLLLYFDLL